MTYRERLEVLDDVLEKAAQSVPAGQWVTVNGKHMLIPTDQYHPTHGWVKVSGADIPEQTMSRQSPGTYHATKSDGTKVDFKEGEATHHAVPTGNTVTVYNTEQGKKVGTYPAGQPLPAPEGGAGKPRGTVQAGARERAPLGPAGELDIPRATGTGAPEPHLFTPTSGPERYSTKPHGGGATLSEREEEPAPGTHEHFAGEYPGKGKKGSMADLHEHLRQNGFSVDHTEGEKNQYGSLTDKAGNTLVYRDSQGREARMVNTLPADQTWDTEKPSYNPNTRVTSSTMRMRRPVTEYTLQ